VTPGVTPPRDRPRQVELSRPDVAAPEAALRLIEVRQPHEHDVVGRRFTGAGPGSGFEPTMLWRVLGVDGTPLAEGPVQGAGSREQRRRGSATTAA
jgi:hypothetical protein